MPCKFLKPHTQGAKNEILEITRLGLHRSIFGLAAHQLGNGLRQQWTKP